MEFEPYETVQGGIVVNKFGLKFLGALALVGVGLTLAGCKSAPELTKTQALALIQAKYDQTPGEGVTIVVNNDGMVSGALAKLWDRTKIYPNRYWADFKLTDAGKKAVKLNGGGDTIEWRPSSIDDKTYTIALTTTTANHLKAKDLADLSDETAAGVDTAKGADFTQAVDLTGVPAALVSIAHNPGNKLSDKQHAVFSYENGAWVLHSVK